MNPQFIKTNTVNNLSENTTETEPLDTPCEPQQCMSDQSNATLRDCVTKPSCLELGDEYLPKGHITTHPFSFTSEELSGWLNDGQVLCENSQTLQTLPNKESSFPIEYPIGKLDSLLGKVCGV